MIDLHLHTTASDGRSSPSELVDQAVKAGLSVIAVVDHDTTASLAEIARLAGGSGLRAISGIEITAVWNGRDVHLLGYHLDTGSGFLQEFLSAQRADRVERVHAIIARLRSLGMAVEFSDVAAGPAGHRPDAIGRPQVARALVRAGYAADVRDAFDRYLAEGQIAFVPRTGASPADVVALIRQCGGIASLAHPALLHGDELVPGLAAAGMQAIEVYHPDHTEADVARYRHLARLHGLVATGGFDFHGDTLHGAPALGRIVLPPDDFARFEALDIFQGRQRDD